MYLKEGSKGAWKKWQRRMPWNICQIKNCSGNTGMHASKVRWKSWRNYSACQSYRKEWNALIFLTTRELKQPAQWSFLKMENPIKKNIVNLNCKQHKALPMILSQWRRLCTDGMEKKKIGPNRTWLSLTGGRDNFMRHCLWFANAELMPLLSVWQREWKKYM